MKRKIKITLLTLIVTNFLPVLYGLASAGGKLCGKYGCTEIEPSFLTGFFALWIIQILSCLFLFLIFWLIALISD